jgi:hypothetical protein
MMTCHNSPHLEISKTTEFVIFVLYLVHLYYGILFYTNTVTLIIAVFIVHKGDG